MKRLIAKLKKSKGKRPTALNTAMHTNQGLMGISALKQMCQLTNHNIPSMSCTHYMAFRGDVRGKLEWLVSCNFLPLMYTGVMTNAKYHTNANYWLENLGDAIENETGRYSFVLQDLELAKNLITRDTVCPHMILDFRGFEQNFFGHIDEISIWVRDIVMRVVKYQNDLIKFGDKWDIEHHHNPMITILGDWDGGYGLNPCIPNYVEVHHWQGKDRYTNGLAYGTTCQTIVRKFTKEELANE